jgi:hypothetical protein
MHALLTVKNVVGVLLVLFPILDFFMVLSYVFMLMQAKRAEQSGAAVQMTATQADRGFGSTYTVKERSGPTAT